MNDAAKRHTQEVPLAEKIADDTPLEKQRNVAILIFDDVEVLDFAGPFEVFNVTGEVIEPHPFNVYTVALAAFPVYARGKLNITPAYSIDDCPPPDILIVPGGLGTRPLLESEALLNWLREQVDEVEYLLSVCTGALLLGKAGLLDGLEATTHHTAFKLLRELAPKAQVIENKRYVDTNGKIITAGGISAGIDMALYVVHKLLGEEALAATLTEMEYEWRQS